MDVRTVVVIHGGVQAGEDGRGEEEGHGLLEELLVLKRTQDDLVVQRRVFPVLRVHGQALEIRHPWKERSDLWVNRPPPRRRQAERKYQKLKKHK